MPRETPTERAVAALPPHLRRFAVDQRWEDYTPRDHAVWRHVLRRLTASLAATAHPRYLAGLAATGIGVDRIPRLDDMNERLAEVGWSAVAVRGFIPPAVFTELQSRRVLAIAADIRSHEHLEYTPAPDIVHESAGHAPFLADPVYAEYLQRAGEVGFRAIASAEDQAVFEAIRNLSVVKEDPAASAAEVAHAEARLAAAGAATGEPSEATRASRLYWWTAEYGLVGALSAPRLYGAGLLSSIGEATHCLGPAVEKRPLTAACADLAYDITRMQPQLFVARDFDQLFEVLTDFERQLSWRRGGDHGLAVARGARTVNHLVLSGGRELSGKVVEQVPAARPWAGEVVVAFGDVALPDRGAFEVGLPDGLLLSGFAVGGGEVVGLRGRRGDALVPLPAWALLFASDGLPAVAGGPADPGAWDRWFGELSTFAAGEGEARARERKAASLPAALAALYEAVRRLREAPAEARDPARLRALREAAAAWEGEWLLGAELDELDGGGEAAGAAPASP